jgi:hypothetical protein
MPHLSARVRRPLDGCCAASLRSLVYSIGTAVLVASRPAGAVEPTAVRSEASASSVVATPAPAPAAAGRWFGVPLALAYAAPLVLVGTAVLIAEDNREARHTAGYLALASLALPPLVRVGYDDAGNALSALLATAGFSAAGALLGLVIGGSTCDADSDGECFGEPIYGAVIGLFTGYVTWAVLDVALLSYTPVAGSSARHPPAPELAFSLTPSITPLWREAGPREMARLQGLALGVSARF